MLTAVRQMPGGRPNNRSLYFGGQGFKVDGKTFDAMTEEHFSIAMREAESHVGRINVVMVGFWNRDKPELGDPNSRVVEFPFTWNPNDAETDLVGDISLRSKLKANVGVTRVPSTGLVNFAFRAADSKWGFMLVYGVGDVRPQVCFFLHLGRDCLLPLAPNGPSVFETARVWCVNAGIEIDRVELIADGGIGSCCYAFPNVDALSKRVSDRYGDDACEEVFLRDKKVNPPNAGGIAISLNNLVDLEFARAFEGIRIIDSNLGNFCTACYGHGADHDVTKRLLSSSARGDGLRRDLIVASFDFSGMEFLET